MYKVADDVSQEIPLFMNCVTTGAQSRKRAVSGSLWKTISIECPPQHVVTSLPTRTAIRRFLVSCQRIIRQSYAWDLWVVVVGT